MRPIKFLFVGLIFLLFSWDSFSQDREFIGYRKVDGLPTSSMHFHMMQDSKGYVWGGTRNGMYRFDGHAFRVFSIQDGLPSRAILRTVEAADGKIWSLTMSGELFWIEGDSIHVFPHNDSLNQMVNKRNISSFQVDLEGTVHFSTKQEGYWTITAKGEIKNPIPAGPPYSGAGVMLFKDQPPLAFGLEYSKVDTLNSLYIFDENLKLLNEISDADLPFLMRYYVPIVVDLKDGSFVLGGGKDLFRFKTTQILQHYHCEDALINSFTRSPNGDLLVPMQESGLYTFPQGNLSYETVRKGTDYMENILWAFDDHEGGRWLAQAHDGIRYAPYPDVVLFDTLNSPIPSPWLVNLIASGDLVYLVSLTGDLISYDGNKFKTLGNYMEPSGRPHTNFPSGKIFHDSANKQLLIGSYNWLSRYSKKLGIQAIALPDSVPDFGFFSGIQADISDEFTWVLFQRRLLQLKDGQITRCIPNPDILRCITQAPDGKLWAGGNNGLWHMVNDAWVHYESEDPLLNTMIMSLLFINDQLWIRNPNKGIAVLKEDTLHNIRRPDLPFESIYDLRTFDGKIWGSTPTGIVRIDNHELDSLTIKTRKIINDLSADVVRIALTSEYVFLTSEKGLYRLDRKTAFQQFEAPPIYLTGITVNGNDTAVEAQYVLDHDQNYLSFRFSGISYHSKELTYQYRLSGIDKGWNSTKEPVTQYPKLPSGEYRFEVRAQNEAGVWSSEPAAMELIIRPPIWATWWFRSLFCLGLFGAVVYLFVSLQKRNTKRFVTDRRMMELELTALRAQMNPHFTFNTITGVQHYIGKLRPDLAQDYLARFAQLMRTILEHANRDSILLEEELTALKLYLELEALRFEGRFSYQIEVDPKLDISFERVPPMLVQPFIENAVYHGLLPKKDQGKLLILISGKRDLLHFVVEDNGIGRAAAQLRKNASLHAPQSMGLNITRERLELLHQKLHQSSDLKISDLFNAQHQPSGTRVEFSIPCQ